ncbi:MAG TPA: phosphoglycerate mutase [Elusimicrobia bacterium]|jgi:broad specificity phosphatase PhoE|nr:phosphoglycerate mutase [Elusimicrobiota bacterium]
MRKNRRTVLILVRHAECPGNVDGVFRGRIDYPLTGTGKEQTKLLAEELREYPIKTIYSSPLIRCRQTAEAIAKLTKVKIFAEEGLNNIKLGAWEGKAKREIKEKSPKLWKLWVTEPEKLSIPEGETLAEVQKRAVKTVKRIVAQDKGKTVLLVTHRAVLKPLIAGLLSLPQPYFWKIHLDNCSYSIIEYNEVKGFTLTLLNQTKHLKSFVEERDSA